MLEAPDDKNFLLNEGTIEIKIMRYHKRIDVLGGPERAYTEWSFDLEREPNTDIQFLNGAIDALKEYKRYLRGRR